VVSGWGVPDMEETRFKLDDFGLYQRAREFRKKIYRLIKQLPREERYCLDPQMRRACVSITNNIAEGHGRWACKETIHYCRIARGSTAEIIDDLNVCIDEGYGEPDCVAALKDEAYELIHRVNSYVAYRRRTQQGTER